MRGEPAPLADNLIPLSVRIAVRNAVGGWGPYTAREIDDLFNSYGCTDSESEVPDAGGVRRTAAEGYQARIDFTSTRRIATSDWSMR